MFGVNEAKISDAESSADDEIDDDSYYVWPENWRTLLVFLAVNTQWHSDINGRVRGIRYEGLLSALHMMHVRPNDRSELFDDIREMEAAALKELNR